MSSKFLSSLSKEDRESLSKKLLEIQGGICYICQDAIDLDISPTDIDHIIPLSNKGKDAEDNFALTHETCNRSKLDADLRIARILSRLKKIQKDFRPTQTQSAASLEQILASFGGAKEDFNYKVERDRLKYSIGKDLLETPIHEDYLSKEKFICIELPLSYIHHDSLINPRGINSSIAKLVKEFFKGNPQLHFSLARVDAEEKKIKIFDGQHKAVAQILLGNPKLFLRIFINPIVDRLIETNTNAGSSLKQIAFDKSIMRQLNNTLFMEKIEQYKREKGLLQDNNSFSEQDIVSYFRGDKNIKKYIIDNIKNLIVRAETNKLSNYIDYEGKEKSLPLSYSTIDKTFLSIFIDSKNILNTNFDATDQDGNIPRELEIEQMVKLMNIIADEIYWEKFKPEVGVSKIEDKVINGKDIDITEDHLIAYRLSKEEIIYNWLHYIEQVIKTFFLNIGYKCNDSSLFQQKFQDQLWVNITNFIRNLKNLPLWKDKAMASTHFSGKKNYSFWGTVLKTGKTPDGVQVLAQPLNTMEMIRPNN